MLTYNVHGRSALPIRAIPLFSPGFFGPMEVMNMLVHVEAYGEAPVLRPFTVDALGKVHGVHPLELIYERDLVKSVSRDTLSKMLAAMPSRVMVWLDEAKARYDFLDHQIFLQEARSARPEVMRIWFDQPAASESVRELVLADKGHMTRTIRPSTTKVKKRQRDNRGTNSEVQMIADGLAKDFRTKHNRWPTKKVLVEGIKEKLPARAHCEDKTIEREFQTTWKKRA